MQSSNQQILPVDFQRIIRQLCVMPMSVYEIALHANVARTCIRDYQNGTQPMHLNGERLIKLWCDKTGNHRDQVPRRFADLAVKRPKVDSGILGTGCQLKSF
jgi:hypothetical protein